MFVSRLSLICLAMLPHRFSASIHPWSKAIRISPLSRSLLAKSSLANNDITLNLSGGEIASISHRDQNSAESGDGEVQQESENRLSVRPIPPTIQSQPYSESQFDAPQLSVEAINAGVTTATSSVNLDEQLSTGKAFRNVSSKRSGLFHHDPHSTAAKKFSKKLKNRNHLNIGRKLTHASFGLFFGVVNQMVPKKMFLQGMGVVTTVVFLGELLRYRNGFGWINDVLHTVFGSSLRKHEMEGKFTGTLYYFLGVTATACCFSKSAATIGIMQLALADPAASYFGRRTRHVYWSRIEKGLMGLGRNKGILGFLGGALFCVPFNCRMLKIANWGPNGIPGGNTALVAASLALGVAGAFADLAVPTPALCMPERICGIYVPPFHVDDNFVVPLVSAFACTKVFNYLGWAQELALSKSLFF